MARRLILRMTGIYSTLSVRVKQPQIFFVDQFDLCDSLFGSLTKNIKKCKYRDANFTFNDFNDRNTLMLLHVNARSLHKNFDSFSDFLEPLKHKPHVICISESQIISQPLISLGLENYSFAHVSPVINRVGGVAVYVHDDMSFRICQNQFAPRKFWIFMDTFKQ